MISTEQVRLPQYKQFYTKPTNSTEKRMPQNTRNYSSRNFRNFLHLQLNNEAGIAQSV
jgi:hypothetical protein